MTRFVLIALLVVGCATAPTASTSVSGADLVIRNARIFDGHTVLAANTAIVSSGIIVAVGSDLAVPPGAAVIDATGQTLLPGLIDSHAHVATEGALVQSAVFGVTTVLDMGCNDPAIGAALKAQAAKPNSPLADLRFAGYAVTVPGGHCTEYGIPVPTVTTVDEVKAFVDARVAEGSDTIKIILDDGSEYGIYFPTITKPMLKAAIDEAHVNGKLAMVHVGTEAAAREALALGADGLAHTFMNHLTDADFVTSGRAFVVPTLSVNRSVVADSAGTSLTRDPNLAPYLSGIVAEHLTKTFPPLPNSQANFAIAEASVRAFRKANIPILAGTDSPNLGTSIGASLHGELELLVHAGLTPVEALVAATSAAAKAFHFTDRGEIKLGARADLVLVDGDPTADITATRKIVTVWRAGTPVDRAQFKKKIAEDAATATKIVTAGLISDFDNGTDETKFGSGWSLSTDAIRGGKSVATADVVAGGAANSKGSLSVSGTVAPGLPFAWSGVMFSPGARPMAPANLSASKEIVFWAKGDGATYQLMLFAQSRGFAPATKTFVAAKEWAEYHFAIADFAPGLDGHGLVGISFVAGPKPGTFVFQLDDVRLR